MNTDKLIYLIFILIVLIDIVLVILQEKQTGWKTISAVFRRWYHEYPLITFMVGILWLGHFPGWLPMGWLPYTVSLIIFISLSVIYLLWCIWNNLCKNAGEKYSRIYDVFAKHWYIPMILGGIIGNLWKIKG